MTELSTWKGASECGSIISQREFTLVLATFPSLFILPIPTLAHKMSLAALAAPEQGEHPNHGLFTCMSCSIAFHSADDQRRFCLSCSQINVLTHTIGEHYRSDHHRYNMKRRVAGLPPVSAALFNQKVLERRAETAIMASPKGSTCEICGYVCTHRRPCSGYSLLIQEELHNRKCV